MNQTLKKKKPTTIQHLKCFSLSLVCVFFFYIFFINTITQYIYSTQLTCCRFILRYSFICFSVFLSSSLLLFFFSLVLFLFSVVFLLSDQMVCCVFLSIWKHIAEASSAQWITKFAFSRTIHWLCADDLFHSLSLVFYFSFILVYPNFLMHYRTYSLCVISCFFFPFVVGIFVRNMCAFGLI